MRWTVSGALGAQDLPIDVYARGKPIDVDYMNNCPKCPNPRRSRPSIRAVFRPEPRCAPNVIDANIFLECQIYHLPLV
jgi:hypothetical protein